MLEYGVDDEDGDDIEKPAPWSRQVNDESPTTTRTGAACATRYSS